MTYKFDVMRLCAKAVVDVPHEPGCNVHFGLACTCKLRAERIAMGLAALVRSVASRRDSLRHDSTESIARLLIAKFRKAASADVTIRIRVQRAGATPQGAT